MCIVIDVNVISALFNNKNNDHPRFVPLLEWLVAGKGKMVYGGTKYKKELRLLSSYFGLILELGRAGKVIEVDQAKVDQFQISIEQDNSNINFNDPHIVAIVAISKCKLVCSCDQNSFQFIKDRRLYPPNVCPPKIYCSYRNRNLLNDNNIAEICKPCSRGTKDLKELF
jgi:predicted nucleic acid-binding protein